MSSRVNNALSLPNPAATVPAPKAEAGRLLFYARGGSFYALPPAGAPIALGGGGGSAGPGETVIVSATEPAGLELNDLWLDPDEGAITTSSAIETVIFNLPGAVSVQPGKSRVHIEVPCVFESVRATVDGAPVGAPLIVDVNLNKTSVYADQSQRPTIAAGATTALGGTASTPTVGQYLTVDVDQVGSSTAGADLTVVVRLRRV